MNVQPSSARTSATNTIVPFGGDYYVINSNIINKTDNSGGKGKGVNCNTAMYTITATGHLRQQVIMPLDTMKKSRAVLHLWNVKDCRDFRTITHAYLIAINLKMTALIHRVTKP
ncbi:hypothetical protein SASC598J21_005530 [Snodgrassella alvi SCGC AB-598-J21]|uniref:Uncharacterized protein n=1 Tax=Snodgrassella alvi SCGC AB-598-J21 TaxID=1385367 RepID=A0A074W2J0_9NEIS|nr:hypothetical protein SASC598J21_005530 [Snodgrassella alvi SCGC AB-598-J21]